MVLGSAWKRLLVVVVCVAGVLALPAVASADVEPNNGITEAEGPLAGGVTYTGAVTNQNDLDTYFFYVDGQQQIDIKVTNTGGSNCLDGTFGDSNNRTLQRFEESMSHDFTWSTPPGVTRYYLEIDSFCSSSETKYSFEITPSSGIVGGPSTLVPVPTGEPSENAEQAIGPLLGDVAYTGEIQTQKDQDWFKFYTAPGTQQFDVAYTAVSGCHPDIELQESGGVEVDDDEFIENDEWSHFTETSTAAGIYYLKVAGGCVGSRYEFVVNPPGALSLSPPPPSAPAPAPGATPAPAKVHRGYAIANPSAKVEKGNALLELTCAGAGDCAGTVSLVARANGEAEAKVVVGSGTFALARGTSTTLPVALSRLGMGMLHLAPNGQVHVHLSGHDLKGGSLLLTTTEGHKRKRHRHHHQRHHRHRHRQARAGSRAFPYS